MGEGGDAPSAGWVFAEGGGFGENPCRTIRAEGGGTGRINIDSRYMGPGTSISKGRPIMPAMRAVQGKGSAADRKNKAPPWGESGA